MVSPQDARLLEDLAAKPELNTPDETEALLESPYGLFYLAPKPMPSRLTWELFWLRRSRLGSASRAGLMAKADWVTNVQRSAPCSYGLAEQKQAWSRAARGLEPLAQALAWPPNVSWESVLFHWLLELELTGRVLEARTKSVDTGDACEGLDTASTVCASRRFGCFRLGEVASISFQGELPETGLERFAYPLSQTWRVH